MLPCRIAAGRVSRIQSSARFVLVGRPLDGPQLFPPQRQLVRQGNNNHQLKGALSHPHFADQHSLVPHCGAPMARLRRKFSFAITTISRWYPYPLQWFRRPLFRRAIATLRTVFLFDAASPRPSPNSCAGRRRFGLVLSCNLLVPPLNSFRIRCGGGHVACASGCGD
jgi:hypothetical protein